MRSSKKILWQFGWLLFAPCLASAGPVANVASSSTSLLSICLVTNVSAADSTSPGSVPRIVGKLITPPILSDHDFVAWDVTNHTFVITPQAAKRLVGDDVVESETWFAVVCSGEPIYFGQFKSHGSSSESSQPVIMTDLILPDCFGGVTNVPNELWPRLRWQGTASRPTNLTERLLAMTNACHNVTLQIESGYPSSEEKSRVSDLRNDRRIVSAAKELFEKQ